MRTPHVLMWWEKRIATSVPVSRDSLEMASLVKVTNKSTVSK